MKSRIIFLWLMMLFGSCLYGQVADLGDYGFRLFKTLRDADFDYERLEYYFSDRARLNAADTEAQTVFEPKESYYTLHYFLGDLLRGPVDDTLQAYYPAALDKQQMLVLKVMESRIITDGFLFPYAHGSLPLSESLFRVRTKGLQLKKRISLQELNLRNLYNKRLRADAGTVYVTDDLFWPEALAIDGLEVRFNLVKKVDGADFNPMLYDFDRYDTAVMREGQDIREVFGPVAGDFVYYQFMADVVEGDRVFPEHMEDRDSFDAKLKTYEAPDVYVHPLIVANNILILKTDATGRIVDGFETSLNRCEPPASAHLRRVGVQGLRLRDGMTLSALGLPGDAYDKDFDTKRKVSLFPK